MAGERPRIFLQPDSDSSSGSPALHPAVPSLSELRDNLVDPVLVAPRDRPRRHPSALHDWDYANLLALDARISRDGPLEGAPASVRLETQDASGHAVTMGTAPVESDGSFFVKTPADRPIRFALLDAKGAVIRQEHGWFWIRRGEQRILRRLPCRPGARPRKSRSRCSCCAPPLPST